MSIKQNTGMKIRIFKKKFQWKDVILIEYCYDHV